MKMERKNKNEKKKKGNSSSSLKVVYISSPMKVKTTASRFRALVQELTGRDSDIKKSMDVVQNCNNFKDSATARTVLPQKGSTMLSKSLSPDDDQYQELQLFSSPVAVLPHKGSTMLSQSLSPDDDQYQELQLFSSPVETTPPRGFSPTSSESLIEQQEVFGSCEAFLSSEEVEDQFLEDVFSSSLFFDQYSQSHLLEGYDGN